MVKCNYHHLVKGDKYLVLDGDYADRADARMVARTHLGVGATVLFAGQINCNDCGKCH